ncbi:cyclic lactone autoinducer peptide [Moorella naiadis]
MFKRLTAMVATLGVALAVLVANGSVLPASVWLWHQPEVPQGLRR